MRHPEYYLGCADEARAIARATVDPKARDVLIKCAEEYEGLARQVTVQKSEELVDRVKLRKPVYVTNPRQARSPTLLAATVVDRVGF
jgi:hypothetical protein